jgi:MYXO-CTERM domain-containing protein
MTLATRSLAPVLGVLFALAADRAAAQPPLDLAWHEIAPSTARGASAYFGNVVAFDGTRIAIGRDGAIDVYRWEDEDAVHEARLEPGPESGTGFGLMRAALVGDRLLTGASGADGGRGAYYAFRRSSSGSWSRTSRELPPLDTCCSANGVFGATSADGTRAVVGAPFFEGGFGAVTVLRADATGAFSMTRSSRFMSPMGALTGFDPSIVGDTVFAGNLWTDHIGQAILLRDTGTALVETMTIANPTPSPGDQFGITGELTADHLYVGARYDDVGGTDAGAVYVFSRAGVLQQTLLGTEALGRFSDDFDVSGDWMVVGVPAFQKPGVSEPERISSIVVFRRDAAGTWQRRGSFAMFGAHLGNAISMSENVAIVSAPLARVGGVNDAGRAWALVLTEPDGGRCDRDAHCTNGHCVDGVCCASVCDGVCESCRGSETGEGDGVCAPVSDGTDPADECAPSACASGVCSAGACDVELACDAGTGEDAGSADDGGSIDDDASTPHDSGVRADAGPGIDAGGDPVARIPLSCTCRATTAPASRGTLVSLALLAWIVMRRRR